MEYPRSAQYSDVRVPPPWHQWLRYRRERAPSLPEQAADLARQRRVKLLAAEADARWDAKPGYLDAPPPPPAAEEAPGSGARGQPVPPLNTAPAQPQEHAARESPVPSEPEIVGAQQTSRSAVPKEKENEKEKEKEDPWKRARPSTPGETWQPEAWTPTPARKR